LTSAARFCPQCGNPVDGDIAEAGQRFYGGAQLIENFRIKIRGKEEPEAPQEVQGVQAIALDHILACSLMDAPLDIDLVLLEYRKKEWADYVPISFVKNLQDMEVHFSASVFYNVDDSESPSVRNFDRIKIPDDVFDAFCNADHRLQMSVQICSKPKDYGEVDRAVRGKWATVRQESEDGGELRLAMTVVPLMLSNYVIKRRLQEHADDITNWLGRTKDADIKKDLERILQVARATMEKLPEGFADHICCQAFMVKDGKAQSLVLVGDDKQEEKEEKTLQALRRFSILRTPQVRAARDFLTRPQGAGAGRSRFRAGAALMRSRAPYRLVR
jgi:hypothetical protein